MEVCGIHNGFRGLLDDEVTPLTEASLGGLLTMGGTILGTSRVKPFRRKGKVSDSDNAPDALMRTIQAHGLDCLVCLPGMHRRERHPDHRGKVGGSRRKRGDDSQDD